MNRKIKKVLITGISGSGGSYLAEYIIKINPAIKIFGTYRKFNSVNLKNIKTKIKIFKSNLSSIKIVSKILKKTKPDVIFHLASDADVKKSFLKPYKLVMENNSITLNLLESVRKYKGNPLIIMCSTSEVYGDVPKKNMPISEKNKINPNNPYAVSKVFQDVLCQTYHKNFDMKIIITRMFTYLNPRRKNLFASHWAYQINKIKLKKQKYLFHGNLNSTRTIMDVRDAVRAYWLAAKKCKVGEIYNIGSNRIIKLKSFMKILLVNAKLKVICKKDKKLFRKTDISFQIPDSRKFKRETKWRPEIGLKDSINFLIEETKKLK